jgi:acetyl esterase/lipase
LTDLLRVLVGSLVLVLAACSIDDPGAVTSPTEPAPAPTVTSSTLAPSTTTTTAPAIVVEEVVIRTRPDGSAQAAVAFQTFPTEAVPLIVVIPGAGEPLSRMLDLGQALADRGAIVLAVETAISYAGGPRDIPEVFPTAMDDAACAVAYALDHALWWGADQASLVIVGHAAGGAAGAFPSLGFGRPGACAFPVDAVAAFVGLSSNPAATSEIGSDHQYVADDPELAELTDITRLFGVNPSLRVRLLTMVEDGFAPVDDIRVLASSMTDAGYDVELIEFDGSSHTILTRPNSEPGRAAVDLIVELARSVLG